MGGRKEKHSHLSSNYTTTLIPLGLQLIARVQTPVLLRGPAVIAAEPRLLPAAA